MVGGLAAAHFITSARHFMGAWVGMMRENCSFFFFCLIICRVYMYFFSVIVISICLNFWHPKIVSSVMCSELSSLYHRSMPGNIKLLHLHRQIE
jgi:hypothetical protein